MYDNLNRQGRPDNWADRTADRLLDVYLSWGKDAANSEWLEILDRDKPVQADAVVAVGRFNAMLAKGPEDGRT